MSVLKRTSAGVIYTRPRSSYLWVRFTRPDGAEVRKSSGVKDLDVAEQFLTELVKRQHEISFMEAVVDFFEVKSRKLKPTTVINYRRSLRSVHPYFNDMTLAEIGSEELKEYVARRRREVSDTTVKRELAFVSTVFTHAIDMMPHSPQANPVIAFSKKSLKEVAHNRWLTVEEYDRLLRACWTDMHRAIITTAVNTGMRHGELTALRKPMLDFDNREVHLVGTQTKSGKPRAIPLNDQALRTLTYVCETAPGDLVFWHPDHRGDFSGQPRAFISFNNFFRKARSRAGLEDVRFHDLRHTFASWWVQKGGGLPALQEILGHSSLDMVQRYAHLDTAAAHREMRQVFSHTQSKKGG